MILKKGLSVPFKRKTWGIHSKKKEAITAYLMLMPNVIGLIVFVFIPIIYAFFVSLHQWNGLTEMKFIAFNNYTAIPADDKFLKSILTTIKYVMIFVPSVYCLGLLLGNLLSNMYIKLQSVFRTAFFLPFSLSTVIAGVIWTFAYDPMKGYFNIILGMLGLPSQKFLASTTQALPSIASVSIWIVLGYNALIFLSAIKDIPVTYYEAASIDGANGFTKFFMITLPLLKETSIFIIVTTTINSFQAFDLIKVMTNGGPAFSTSTTVFYIYQQSFGTNKIGYASAIAFILFITIMTISLIQLNILNKQGGEING